MWVCGCVEFDSQEAVGGRPGALHSYEEARDHGFEPRHVFVELDRRLLELAVRHGHAARDPGSTCHSANRNTTHTTHTAAGPGALYAIFPRK